MAHPQISDDQFERPMPYTDVQSAEIISSSVKLCSNTVYNFEISYPKDWFTTYNNEPQKCTFFAPYSFIVPTLVENNFVPIKISIIKSEDWQTTIQFQQIPNETQNVIAVKNLEVNSRPIVKIETSSTSTAQTPRGFVTISYFIQNDLFPLAITYQQLDPNDDISQYQRILEDMVTTLKYL